MGQLLEEVMNVAGLKLTTKEASAEDRKSYLAGIENSICKTMKMFEAGMKSEKAVSAAEVRPDLQANSVCKSTNEPETTSSMDANFDEVSDLGEKSNLLESMKSW
jgi:hypothetical protein